MLYNGRATGDEINGRPGRSTFNHFRRPRLYAPVVLRQVDAKLSAIAASPAPLAPRLPSIEIGPTWTEIKNACAEELAFFRSAPGPHVTPYGRFPLRTPLFRISKPGKTGLCPMRVR